MNKKLSEKEIKMVGKLAAEIKREASDKLSLEENMRISLASRVEGIDEKKEIDELCSGIHDFDQLLGQMETDGEKAMIIETLERSGLSQKSMKEQYTILAEGMEAFKADLAAKGYDLGQVKDVVIKKDEEVTEEGLNAMKNAMAEYLEQFALLHGEQEVMEKFFRSIGEDVLEKLLEAYENDEERYYTALAIHILQLQGELEPSLAGMGARGIGVSAAAFIESAKVHIKGILGRIPKDEIMTKLKAIASTALTVLVGVAIVALAYETGKFFALLMTIIFGYGIIGTIASLVVGFLFATAMADALYGLWEDAKEAAEEAKDYMTIKLAMTKIWMREEGIPALKEFWEKLKEKVACLASAITEAGAEEEERPEGHGMERKMASEAERGMAAEA
ncbi:hypothetical protein IMSAGC002_03004 [Lachnospiraceae bacterium]|nr:hypothetical protein IMSAGC002_03004 [Lachnospiraceae bacterium]